MNISDNCELYLNDNRLSGNIPPSIVNIQNISVLEGNMFACSYNLTAPGQIPRNLPNDHNVSSYECGSSSVESALATYAIVLLICITIIAVIHLTGRYQWIPCYWTRMKSLGEFVRQSLISFDQISDLSMNGSVDTIMLPEIVEFGVFLRTLRTQTFLLSTFAVVILCPIYSGECYPAA